MTEMFFESLKLSLIAIPVSVPLGIWLKVPMWAGPSFHLAAMCLVRAAYL